MFTDKATGLPTKDETSKTTEQNLYLLFPIIQFVVKTLNKLYVKVIFNT